MAIATKPTDYSKMNILQKLNKARVKFLQSGAEKSGKNRAIGYKYFELDDILPKALPIFDEVGLCSEVAFVNNTANMYIYNADNPEESPKQFVFDTVHIEPNKSMNPAQAIGCEITYYTRYLWLMALQITEADGFDADQKPDGTATAPAKVVPPTKEERKEIVEEITNTNMSELQKKSIVNGLKALRDSDGNHEVYIKDIQTRIKEWKIDNTKISSKDAEDILIEIGKKLKG